MAGGKGERFWPLSTGNVPKPFLQLTGEKTLIQLTVARALRFVQKKRIFVILGKKHLKVAQKQLPELPPDNFIVEPAGRDTAACIGLAAITLLIRDDKATMVVLPADQYVPDIDSFADTMRHCVDLAQEGSSLITMGITPTRPETGYGYIKVGKNISSFDNTCLLSMLMLRNRTSKKRLNTFMTVTITGTQVFSSGRSKRSLKAWSNICPIFIRGC
jgi:mannose-1-phosphate guanylyltransferase